MEHPVHLALVLTDGPWALAVALFASGLAGGFVHCAAMCGPFVMAQTLARMDAGPRRLAGAALAPYHAGRLVSYAALGGVLGGLGGALAAVPGLGAAIPISLASAGILFALQAWGKAFGGQGGAAGAWLGRKVRPLLESPGPGRGFGVGGAVGLMKYGRLYEELESATDGGGAARSARVRAARASCRL